MSGDVPDDGLEPLELFVEHRSSSGVSLPRAVAATAVVGLPVSPSRFGTLGDFDVLDVIAGVSPVTTRVEEYEHLEPRSAVDPVVLVVRVDGSPLSAGDEVVDVAVQQLAISKFVLSNIGRRNRDVAVRELHVPLASEVNFRIDPPFGIVSEDLFLRLVVDVPLYFFGSSHSSDHSMDPGHKLDVFVVALGQPRAESYKSYAVDVDDPEVRELIGDVVPNFILRLAFALLDVGNGGVAFDFPGGLVSGASFGNGLPSDFPQVAVPLELPSLPERVSAAAGACPLASRSSLLATALRMTVAFASMAALSVAKAVRIGCVRDWIHADISCLVELLV